jgi:hypothetical protein
MGRPAGRTHLPKWIGTVRAGFAFRDPTQTNRFRPLWTPKWVDPLEMPLCNLTERVDLALVSCHVRKMSFQLEP